jgi:sugar lactone lactonase YvrE
MILRHSEVMKGFDVYDVPAPGAEDVLVGVAGRDLGCVYTGTADGAVYRVRPDGLVDRVARTGGRPLGLEHLPDGRVLVCDAYRGLLAVDVRSGAVEPLLLEVDGRPMKFCNNAAVAADGTVYFTDSSAVHGIDRWQADFVEMTRTGRLLRRSPDGAVDVLLEGLAFANGVALAADESWVVVAETGARTLVRYRLAGPLAGTREWFARDLPGYPDNIALGSDGLVWVSIASPRDPVVERLQRAPVAVRRAATRIPARLQPAPKRTVRVQAYDGDGHLVHDLDLGDDVHGGRYHMVTGVREHEGRVWLGSLHESAVAVVTLQA